MATNEQAFITYPTWHEEETRLYLHLQANAKVVKTRWADEEVLKEMEIHNQVKYLLQKMDMGDLLSMNYETYPQPTLEFLSTVTMIQGKAPGESDVYLLFRIKGDLYKISNDEICQVYGFDNNDGLGYGNGLEADFMWKKIAFGSYNENSAKLTKVRNPTIRYILELLGNTFVAKSSPKLVDKLSLRLLFRSVKTIMKGPSGETMEDFFDETPNNAMVFISEILDYNEGLRTTPHPRIHIGGFLTPLFRFIGIDLSEFRSLGGVSKMDMGHLVKEKFLHGYHGIIGINFRMIYLFIDEERQRQACYLPLQEHTTGTKDENLSFHLPRHLLINRNTLPSEPRLYKSNPKEDQPKIEEYGPDFEIDQEHQEPPMDRQLTEYETYLKRKVDNQEKVLAKQGSWIKRLWKKVTKSEKYNRYASSSEEENEDEDLQEQPRYSVAHPPLEIREPRERRESPRSSYEEPSRRRNGKDRVGEPSRPRARVSKRRNHELDSSAMSTKHSFN